MTRQRRVTRLVAGIAALGLIAAACGGDDDAADEPADEPADATEEPAAEPSDEPADEPATDLASVCPATVAIQTDWFPEAEHGALYHLIGDDYAIDTDKKVVSGSMVVNGEPTGVNIEVRAGGPAIASPSVAAEMYLDDSLTLGYGTTDSQILRYEEAPLLSVMAPLEENPQIIYWDPETYPDVTTLADLGELGVTINVFGGGTFSDVFVALGVWNADQIDPSYDATPGRFIAEGDIAQQGFASAEPWLYKNQFEEYGRDLAFETLNDAGFPVYSQTLAIRPDDLETLRPCLEQLIPIVQQATVDYYANPADTNALIVEVVEAYASFWEYPAELADFSVATQLELGFAGNGPDSTVGNMDEARVQQVIDAMRTASMDFPDDLTPADLVTNEFIDESIGFSTSGGEAAGGDDGESAAGGDGVLKLGGILPETGNLAFLGPPEFAAVQLGVNDVNAAGGVLGADVEWLPGDSGDNGEVANATVDRLLAEDVDAFIGAASSGVSLTVIDKITQAGKVHFSPANTSPTFTTYDDNGLYFRTAPSDVVQGAALADVMLADGAETAAFLVLNDAYGTGLQQFTIEPYTAGGGTVVYGETETYDPQAENFDAEIAAVVDANPDAIVIIGFDETSKILGGLIEAGFGPSDKLVYGTDGNMGNALAAAFDDPSVVAGMKGTLPGVDVAGTMAEFRDALLGVDSGLIDFSYSAESYDTVIITALAAAIAGSDDGVAIGAEINGVTRDGEKCTTYADCLALVEAGTDIDYDGVSGPLEFIDAGEPSVASILILQFDDTGALEVVGSVEGAL